VRRYACCPISFDTCSGKCTEVEACIGYDSDGNTCRLRFAADNFDPPDERDAYYGGYYGYGYNDIEDGEFHASPRIHTGWFITSSTNTDQEPTGFEGSTRCFKKTWALLHPDEAPADAADTETADSVYVVSFKLYVGAKNVSNIISGARDILVDAVEATVLTEFVSGAGGDGETSVVVVGVEDVTEEMQQEIEQAEEMVEELGA
jgi:hypothetical protein